MEAQRQLEKDELDKAVALAFEFKPRITWEIFNQDETATMIGFEREAEAIKWWDEHPSVHAEHHIGKLEHYEPYSSDLNLAIPILERVASDYYIMSKSCLESRRDEPYRVIIVHGVSQTMADGKTMAEACARAALNAATTRIPRFTWVNE